MLKLPVYNQEGEKVGEQDLDPKFFGLAVQKGLIHQAAVAQAANRRQVVAHTKDRGEVAGGGRKPWRQKGTGRARHGSIRSPLWRGGGVTFGPTKERVFKIKINKKARRKAILMCLSDKIVNNRLILLDKLEIPEAKTKKFLKVIENLGLKVGQDFKKGTLIVLPPSAPAEVIRASRNLPKISTIRADTLNVIDILQFPYLLMPLSAVPVIQETYKL